MLSIRAHNRYPLLSGSERSLVEQIMVKAEHSNRRGYYFTKLKLLLDTPTVPPDNTKALNVSQIDNGLKRIHEYKAKLLQDGGVEALESFLSRQRTYEITKQHEWHRYCPNTSNHCYYISTKDPLDLLVHVFVHLTGDVDLITKELEMVPFIERHLSIPGFNVVLDLVGYSGKDVFDVDINPNLWATNGNWSAGLEASAHELMHLFGLPDAYDRIEGHAGNKYLDIETRLVVFLMQMDDVVLPDADQSIMSNRYKHPLQRDVCAAVGLGKDCVKMREAKYGTAT
jgi:hypothetical protein